MAARFHHAAVIGMVATFYLPTIAFIFFWMAVIFKRLLEVKLMSEFFITAAILAALDIFIFKWSGHILIDLSVLKSQIFWLLLLLIFTHADRIKKTVQFKSSLHWPQKIYWRILLSGCLIWYVARVQSHEFAILMALLIGSEIIECEFISWRGRASVILAFLFFYVTVNRSATAVLTLALILRFMSPKFVSVAIIAVSSAWFAIMPDIDIRFEIIANFLKKDILVDTWTHLIFGGSASWIEDDSPFMALFDFHNESAFLKSIEGVMPFSAVHNQWLHILLQYGFFALCYVLHRIYMYVKATSRTVTQGRAIMLLLLAAGFSHSMVLHEVGFLWAFLRSYKIEISARKI